MEPCVSCIYLTYCLEYVWKSSLWIGIFQRAEWVHNVQECYWPTIYRAGAAVVSTIISCKSFSCVFRICTRAISILSILAFLMTVDPRNKLRWSYYRCKWVKRRFSRCNWDARVISKEMHESSTTVCTATGVTGVYLFVEGRGSRVTFFFPKLFFCKR